MVNLATLVFSSAASSIALFATVALIYFSLLITEERVSGSNVVENSTRERRGLVSPIAAIFCLTVSANSTAGTVSSVVVVVLVSPSGAFS